MVCLNPCGARARLRVCAFVKDFFMRCLNPIMMYDVGITPNGKRKFSPVPSRFAFTAESAIPVPCGKCSACLSRRKAEWISRLRLECFSSAFSSFVTLTYRDAPCSLIKRDVQNFIKRLRNLKRDFGIDIPPVRYFVVGEYGKKFHRPHWHGIFFGVDFLQPVFLPSLVAFKGGYPIYSSQVLEKVWSNGFVTVDRANDLNIKYVAKYCVKDNPVVLRSQGLGRSLLVSVRRKRRKSSYSLRPLYLQSVDVGKIMLPDKVKGFSPVGIPKAFDRYLERCDVGLFQRVKDSRADFVSSLPFDSRSSADLERTINVLSATNKERLLDDES